MRCSSYSVFIQDECVNASALMCPRAGEGDTGARHRMATAKILHTGGDGLKINFHCKFAAQRSIASQG